MPAGQPKHWSRPEDMERDFSRYIEDCKTEGKLPNIAGFCCFCGITRETFYTYRSDYVEFSDTTKKIEQTLEEVSIQAGSQARNPAFMIFYLKNKFGWADKCEINANIEQKTTISAAELETKLKKLISQYKTDSP